MKTGNPNNQLPSEQETIRALQEELVETQRGVLVLMMELEKRVEERTAELSAANEQLRREIDERKQAEQALQLSEEKFAKAFAGNPAAIALTRLEDGLFLDANDTWVTMNGYRREEVIGRCAREMHIWPTAEAAARFVQALREKGSVRGLEQQFHKKSGEVFVAELSAQVLTVRGEKVILSTLVDITARRRAEESLRELNQSLEQRVVERTAEVRERSDQLRALATELTQAEQRERKRLSTILHDHIQQLLVAARMQVEWLKRDNNPDRRQAAAQGLDGILKEALEASRSLAVELSPPVLHTAGLIGALNWLASRTQQTNQFAVHLHADNKAEPATEAARFLLFECVRELLLNAVKHSGVQEAQVMLLRTKDDRIKLMVRDQGKGFDPDLLKKRRADEISFGLFSIEQRLAHIGGEMYIATAPGKGTTITLTIPVGAAQPRAQIGDETAGSEEQAGTVIVRDKTATSRVLIVDDHKIMREGLAGIIQFEPDIEVVGQAADGPVAVELAAKLQPDVIIMDINLGAGMNGVEATKRILAANPNIKVIGLSMHTDNDVATALRDAGAVAYLTKGGPSEDLIAAIRLHASGAPENAAAGAVMRPAQVRETAGTERINTATDALIVEDVQRDFCPGGALPVPGGDEVVPPLNQWLRVKKLFQVATRDWHPANHCSFKRSGGPWPDHCVQNTPGADFHPGLSTRAIDLVVSKATDPAKEAYSSFDAPELLAGLKARGIRRLWIGGLATEYCVKATVLDGRKLGFDVFVIEDAIRGIEVESGDIAAAREEMARAGAIFVQTGEVLGRKGSAP